MGDREGRERTADRKANGSTRESLTRRYLPHINYPHLTAAARRSPACDIHITPPGLCVAHTGCVAVPRESIPFLKINAVVNSSGAFVSVMR